MDMFRSDMANRMAIFSSENNGQFPPSDPEFNMLLLAQWNHMDKERENENSPWSDYTTTAKTKIQEFVYSNGAKVVSEICVEFDIEEWEEATTKKRANENDDNATAKKGKSEHDKADI